MIAHFCIISITVALLSTAFVPKALAYYDDCENPTYYDSILPLAGLYNRTSLQSLLKRTHRSNIPYTSSSRRDVWDALIDIDSDANGEVHLVYSDVYVPALPTGKPDTWNREHVWPKSLGVCDNGPDYTDLHSLRPSDWNVNAARSNRFFAPCGIAQPNTLDNCVTPAHPEASSNTQRDTLTFLPALNVRGDLARAILYMEMRYDGTEDRTENLTVTDCPNENPTDKSEMAYLSQLLEWHEQDPPDEEEIYRNYKVCRDWQGNRNPFVDFPVLVSYYHGLKRTPLGDGLGYDCSHSNLPSFPPTISTTIPTPGPSRTVAPTSTPTPTTGRSCKGLKAGDIMLTGFRSDSSDSVVLAALTDVLDNTVLYMTDNAWTGKEFRTNEGTVELSVPSGGILAGSLFGFGDDIDLPYASSWQSIGGSFALSTVSDTIFVYCLDDNAITGEENSIPIHLSALSYNKGGWVPANLDATSFGSGASALPSRMPPNTVTTLTHQDNYRYIGPRTGRRDELLEALTNADYWRGSSSSTFNIMTDQTGFILRPGSSSSVSPSTISTPTPPPPSASSLYPVATSSLPTVTPTQPPQNIGTCCKWFDCWRRYDCWWWPWH